MLRWYTLMLCLGLLLSQASANTDTLSLPLVQVRDSSSTIGVSSMFLDEEILREYRFQSVAELLQAEGLAYIKNYGVGNIATVSLRGGTASQTAVLWDGVPIQSPMLGLQDLSLLAVGLFDGVSITEGGSSTIHGASGVTGALNLHQGVPDSSLSLSIGGQIGSFGLQSQQLRLSTGSRRWRARMSGQHRAMDNNYTVPFNVLWNADRLPHAKFTQWSATGELYYLPNHRQQFSLRYWHQVNERQLPPTSRQRRSLATQDDEANRLLMTWRHLKRRGVQKVQLAWFRERTNYVDALQGFIAPSQYDNFLVAWDHSTQWSAAWRWQYGWQAQYATAEATGYPESRDYYRLAIFQELAWQAPTKTWGLALSGRLARISTQQTFPGVALRLNGSLGAKWGYSLRLARDYRLPGLNDLFWNPGGQEDLATETAWVQEGKIQHDISPKTTFEIGFFNRWTRNWIQWSQVESGFFAVGNINKVWSRGATLFAQHQYAGFIYSLRYQLALATYRVSLENPRIIAGDQLWYTPEHQFIARLMRKVKRWQFTYQHQWQSRTTGINAELPAFGLSQLSIGFHQHIRDTQLHFQFQLQNAFDIDYEVVEFRPMPGRSLQLQIAFEL